MLKERLKNLDILRMVPESAKESSVIGVCFSLTFAILAAILFINELGSLLVVAPDSELVVDHMKDNKDITVSVDIEMPAYPCAMLSLDKMDIIHSHIVDVQEGLTKFRLDSTGKKLGKFLWSNVQTVDEIPFDQKINTATGQIENGEGCRVVGDFTIKAVPGNFHISMHNYGDLFQALASSGKWEPDLSHKIHNLSFGGSQGKSSAE